MTIKMTTSINRKFKKCLITGIGGSGASYLAEYIIKNNPKIKVLGIARKNNVITKKLKNKLLIYKCDLNKFEQLKKHNGMPGDIVFSKMADPIARACILPNIREKFLYLRNSIGFYCLYEINKV